jgi:hypothetical protein
MKIAYIIEDGYHYYARAFVASISLQNKATTKTK